MIRLYFYVEGQTEQEYVTRVLSPHLVGFGVQVMGPVLTASRRRHGHVFRGGGKIYQPMRKDLGRLLRQESGADVHFTTMFDLYALYSSFPGWDEAEKQPSRQRRQNWLTMARRRLRQRGSLLSSRSTTDRRPSLG